MNELVIRSPIGGAPIYYLAEIDSTMAAAREAVNSGAPSGVVVLTDFQTAGRGRLPGRKWISPPGESLMFTVALEDPVPQTMPLRAGLAVALTLESAFGFRPQIKWPNDVMVRDRKICGILCEYTRPWLYVGMGLNLAQREFPRELGPSVTSVAMESDLPDRAHDVSIQSREDILLSILTGLSDTPRYDPSEWPAMVTARLWRRGERTTVTGPDGGEVTGTIKGIDGDGSLRILRAETEIRLVAGELGLPGNGGTIP